MSSQQMSQQVKWEEETLTFEGSLMLTLEMLYQDSGDLAPVVGFHTCPRRRSPILENKFVQPEVAWDVHMVLVC